MPVGLCHTFGTQDVYWASLLFLKRWDKALWVACVGEACRLTAIRHNLWSPIPTSRCLGRDLWCTREPFLTSFTPRPIRPPVGTGASQICNIIQEPMKILVSLPWALYACTVQPVIRLLYASTQNLIVLMMSSFLPARVQSVKQVIGWVQAPCGYLLFKCKLVCLSYFFT